MSLKIGYSYIMYFPYQRIIIKFISYRKWNSTKAYDKNFKPLYLFTNLFIYSFYLFIFI